MIMIKKENTKNMNSKTGKILRIIAVVLMGLTAAMNLLGGVGTTCAAFFTKKYPPMWALMDYQWLYQTLVVLTVPLGLIMIWATIILVRGKSNALKIALWLLVVGTVLGAVHMGASLALRGKAVPANVKLYLNLATLIVFFFFTLPGVRKYVDFSKPGGASSGATAGGLAAIVVGLVMLTTVVWAAPTHTYQGENWVNVIYVPLMTIGTLFTLSGFGLLAYALWRAVDADLSLTDSLPAKAAS
jgi:hypothetical protein